MQEAFGCRNHETSPDGLTPSEQLKEISKHLRPLSRCKRGVWKIKSYRLSRQKDFDQALSRVEEAREKIADDYFLEHVLSILTPQAVDPGHPFPYVSNLSPELCLMVAPPGTLKGLKSPEATAGARLRASSFRRSFPGWVPSLIQKGMRFTFLGSLIAQNAHTLFPKMRTGKCHLFRVTVTPIST